MYLRGGKAGCSKSNAERERKPTHRVTAPVDTPRPRPSVLRMITLTPRAAARIRSLVSQSGDADRVLRVFVEAGGCSGLQYGMTFEAPRAGDVTLESEDVRFVTDPASLELMSGSSIDFDDGLTGKGFEIRNPRATQTCGCGKSFA